MDTAVGKVGPFFYLDGQIISDSIAWSKAETYGDFNTWGSHDRFWTRLSKTLCHITEEYYSIPRGRITYNRPAETFHIYLNPALNTPGVLDQIIREYDLSGKKIVIDDTDLHYRIYSDAGFEALLLEMD